MSDEIFHLYPWGAQAVKGEYQNVTVTPGVAGCLLAIVSPFFIVPGVMAYMSGGQPPMLVFMGIFYLALFKGLSFAWKKFQEHQEIMAKGELVGGILTSVEVKKDSDGDPVLHVTYKFQDPSGTTHEGKAQSTWRREKVPAVGTPVAVKYLNPKKFTVL